MAYFGDGTGFIQVPASWPATQAGVGVGAAHVRGAVLLDSRGEPAVPGVVGDGI